MNKKNVPNILTFLRFALAIFVVILLHFENQIFMELACIGVILAGASDIFDGVMARRYRVESDLGRFMDPIADKFLIVGALVMLVWWNRLIPVLAILLILREILITGVRAIAGSQGIVISAGAFGKIKTTLQMIGIGALILHDVYFGINAHLLGSISLWASLFFSLTSGYDYIRNYLKVRP
ncbi:MAG: CDP-diacylglycerol--glycerol-3-phosphate 3-phosphatidyltransferase [Deltaproteobacteria bacterium]|nr:CDP-diacylglycerol--glycerol-3-phosphate 3-phosphatidyltransferase [Deltaproteobacteria bacterium]